jgi:hypothetical protein
MSPLMADVGNFPRLPMLAHANGQPRATFQLNNFEVNRTTDGGQPRSAATPSYPAGLLDVPVSKLLDEIMFWHDLDIRGVSRFDITKNGLQDVMTRRPPPRPANLRQAKICEIK